MRKSLRLLATSLCAIGLLSMAGIAAAKTTKSSSSVPRRIQLRLNGALFGICGNARIEASEQCDDGNVKSGDGCSSYCRIEPGWACKGSPTVCKQSVICGDAKIVSPEQCDDGNARSGDGCSSLCKLEGRRGCADSDGVGFLDPATGNTFMRYSFSTGGADAQSKWMGTLSPFVLAGDWTGTGVDKMGLYNPKTSQFTLDGVPTFGFGAAGAGWLPVAGDWNGDGKDTVGLYDQKNLRIYLRNTNTTGGADVTNTFMPSFSKASLPIAGDWDGDGKSSLGLYDPAVSKFTLDPATSIAKVISFGAPNWVPLAVKYGSTDVIGLYNPASSQFYIAPDNNGNAKVTFGFGAAGAGWKPVMGLWKACSVK